MNNEYIRREDAKDALQEKVFHNLTDEFYGAMQVLDELEPADVVPLRHARWRHYEGMYACEACGAQLDDESPFCPMCGAKMDSKREE